MKALSIVICVIAFNSGLANSANYIDYPSISFSTPVTIDNVCATETTLRTINPVKVCLEVAVVARYACATTDQVDQVPCRPLAQGEQPRPTEILKEDTQCINFGLKNLETPREYQTRECANWSQPRNPDRDSPECTSWMLVTHVHPVIYRVNIVNNDGEQSYKVVGTKTFVLPACQ